MDIVKRLRRWSAEESTYELLSDAADEIERLRQENERLHKENGTLWGDMLGIVKLLHKMKNKIEARKALGEKE
jgi:hypothetical protein